MKSLRSVINEARWFLSCDDNVHQSVYITPRNHQFAMIEIANNRIRFINEDSISNNEYINGKEDILNLNIGESFFDKKNECVIIRINK